MAAERAVRAAERGEEKAAAEAGRLKQELKALQSFSVAMLGGIKEQAVYTLLAQTAVQQLHWDAALVIEIRRAVEVKASFHLTERQRSTLAQELGRIPKFLEKYAHHDYLSTIGKDDPVALALRTVFHTDEVVGVPLLFGDQLFGYLLVCAHTVKNHKRTGEDAAFLKQLASVACQAVESSRHLADLEQQVERLRKLDELKDSFISITSHQLRTPLSIVKWILSILDGDPKLKELPEQHTLVAQAYVSNERLIHVVNDLLNVSRIQDGKLPYSPQLSDIRVMLRDLVSGMQKLLDDKKVSLIARIDAGVPPLQLDPLLFKEAIQNLLDNALDYNQEGGTIRLELANREHDVTVAITNTGMGIKEDELDTIFNQFYRSKEAMKTHPNGNGLGLFLSRAIVRQHGGEVTCVSEPGKETTFTVTIPHERKARPGH